MTDLGTFTGEPEEWRSICDMPEYEVSSLGRIRRVSSLINKKLYEPLTPRPGPYGYPNYLFKFGKKKWRRNIHPLVCRAFHGPKPTPKHGVAHNDGSRDNNRASNLRWVTQVENSLDSIRHGTSTRGERNAFSKLNKDAVLEIRREYRSSGNAERNKQLMAKFGISRATLCNVANRKSWSWLGDEN